MSGDITLTRGWNSISSFEVIDTSDLDKITSLYSYTSEGGYEKVTYDEQKDKKGDAYWAYVSDDITISYSSPETEKYTYSFSGGWNILSNPFDVTLTGKDIFGDNYNYDENPIVGYDERSQQYIKLDKTNPSLERGKGYMVLLREATGPIELERPDILSGTFIYRTSDNVESCDTLPIVNSGNSFRSLNFSQEDDSNIVDNRRRVTVNYEWNNLNSNVNDGINFYSSNDVIEKFGNIPLIRESTNPNKLGAFATFTGSICDGAGMPTLLENTNLSRCFHSCLITNSSFGNDISYWNTSNVNNLDAIFNDATNFNQSLNKWNTSLVTSMRRVFWNDQYFNQPLNDWDTSNVKDMNGFLTYNRSFNQDLNTWNVSNCNDLYAFFYNTPFNQSLNDWDTFNVNNMEYLFAQPFSVNDRYDNFNQPLNKWNTSNVTSMFYMFAFANDFNQPLNKWNTSNVTSMSYMFADAINFNQPLNDWDTSNVNNMRSMFNSATNFNQPLNDWDTSNVNSMTAMFYNATNFNQPLNKWNTSNVNNMRSMFYNSFNFNQSLNSWNTSNVNSMYAIFAFANNFNQPLNDWNTSNVNDMGYMFFANNFNQSLNRWNTSNVNFMYGIFAYTKRFNQPLNDWNTSKVIYMTSMFDSANDFNQPLNDWNTSNVTDMRYMFNQAIEFNQPLNTWNTSNVDTMWSMFDGAEKFNQSLNDWNTSYVYDMDGMFCDAKKFNGDITSWDTSNVIYMNTMFKGACDFNQDITGWSVCDNLVGSANDMFCDATTWLSNYSRKDFCDSNYNGPVNDWEPRYLEGIFIYRTDKEITNKSDLPIKNEDNGFLRIEYTCDSDVGSDGRRKVEVRYVWDKSKTETATCDGLIFYDSNDIIVDFGNIPLIREGNGRTLFNNQNMSATFSNFKGIICDGAGTPSLLKNTNLSGCFLNCFITNNDYGNDIPYWNTSNVTNMHGIFASLPNSGLQNRFNQSLNNWDVSNVIDMGFMFNQSLNFNQPLNKWDTSNVINMKAMFRNTTDFNQPLDDWNTFQCE